MKITKNDMGKLYLLIAFSRRYIVKITNVNSDYLAVKTELIHSFDNKNHKKREFFELSTEGTWTKDVKLIEEIDPEQYPEYFI